MKILKKIKSFIVTIFIGGIGVILPIAVLYFLFTWLLRIISSVIAPLTERFYTLYGIPVLVSSVILVSASFLLCFFIGLVVRTRTGKYLYSRTEKYLLSKVPGYSVIREAVKPFFDTEKAKPVSFSRPALIRPYGGEVRMTAFITDYHEKTRTYTAFVPTSPNPTSGLVFHLPSDRVEFLDASFEKTMRSIVAGGNGSGELFDTLGDAPSENSHKSSAPSNASGVSHKSNAPSNNTASESIAPSNHTAPDSNTNPNSAAALNPHRDRQ